MACPSGPVYVTILWLVLTTAGLLRGAPVLDLKEPSTVERLRAMFERGQRQAITDFYEQSALSAMSNSNNSTHPQLPITNKFIPITLVPPPAGISGTSGADGGGPVKYLFVKQLSAGQDTDKETRDTDEQAPLAIEPINKTHEAHSTKSDARQSSLFGGFPGGGGGLGNGFGASNPFGGGLFRPAAFNSFPPLPTLAPFGPFGLQQSRPPKTAIIGNGGGAMALTNDNVVVVNVLSGNY